MNLRKYNIIIQIIYYLFFNIFFLQSIKSSEKLIIKYHKIIYRRKFKIPNLQEDLYLLGSGDSINIFSYRCKELELQA